MFLFLGHKVALQVKHFRGLCGVDVDDQSNVQVDASGLKKLFSHGIRRFCSGSLNKVPCFKMKIKQSNIKGTTFGLET